jgi:hypothetical protein
LSGAPSRVRLARNASLLVLGALAVHQLRYWIAFGNDAAAVMHREGHGYLAMAAPVLVALAAATVAAALLAAALSPQRRQARPGTLAAASLYALALFTVFGAQELTEGFLAAGHPRGLAGVVGGGAWIALPLSLAIGLASAALARLLDRAEAALGESTGRRSPPRAAVRTAPPRTVVRRAPLASMPLAFGLARRPPPLVRLA